MPICRGCGASYDNELTRCPYCQRVRPSKRKPREVTYIIESAKQPEPKPIEAPPKYRRSGVECPKCRKDDAVMKVTSLIERDETIIQGYLPIAKTYQEPGGGIKTNTEWSHFAGIKSSDLAKKLLPPREPARRDTNYRDDVVFKILGVLLILSGAIPGIAISANTHKYGFLVCGAVFVILGVVSWFIGKAMQRKGNAVLAPEKRLWKYKIQRWNELYYCSRDGSIYIPGSNTAGTVSNMQEYLAQGYVDTPEETNQ